MSQYRYYGTPVGAALGVLVARHVKGPQDHKSQVLAGLLGGAAGYGAGDLVDRYGAGSGSPDNQQAFVERMKGDKLSGKEIEEQANALNVVGQNKGLATVDPKEGRLATRAPAAQHRALVRALADAAIKHGVDPKSEAVRSLQERGGEPGLLSRGIDNIKNGVLGLADKT